MRKYLFAVLFGLFTCPLFATGIVSGATSADCDNATLGQYNGTANLEMDWQPNTINVRWYSDDTQLSVPTNAQTCSYGGDLYLPSAPTKKGYTFEGWELKHAIPEEYTELEYIQSTGTQYIDTGIKDTSMVRMGISVTEYNSVYTLFYGSQKTNPIIRRLIVVSKGNLTCDTGSNDVSSVVSVNFNTSLNSYVDITVKFSTTAEIKYGGNVYTANSTGDNASTGLNDFLFAYNYGGSSLYNVKARMYFAKVWGSNGNLVRNFIPAKHNSDNALGMYDTVSGNFFTNSGSGTFTAGPVVQ